MYRCNDLTNHAGYSDFVILEIHTNSGLFVVRIPDRPAMQRVWFAALIAMFIPISSADCIEPSATPSRIVSPIWRQPVESSAIANIGYSKRRRIREIEFKWRGLSLWRRAGHGMSRPDVGGIEGALL